MDLKEIDMHTRNRVDLAQNRDYWRALVNATLKFHKLMYVDFVIVNYHLV